MKSLVKILILLSFLSFPTVSLAAGLVPCGGEGEPACQLCHIFVLFDNILRFIFFDIVPPLAILMIAIGSLYFLFSMGDPGKITQGKSILRSTAIALLIIYGAWIIVNFILTFPGLINPNLGWNPAEWFQLNIDCP